MVIMWKKICCDSAFSGKREMLLLTVNIMKFLGLINAKGSKDKNKTKNFCVKTIN